MKFPRSAKRPKDIDLILPGLGIGTGRNQDRFRCSSETHEAKPFEARVAMVRDLASRLLFDVLVARLDGRFTTVELYNAYRQGDGALHLLRVAQSGKLLSPLLEQFSKESAARGKEKYGTQIERYLETIGGEAEATTDKFTTESVADFLAQLKNLTRNGEADVSSGTQNRYRAALQGFASWLVRRRHLAVHPIAFKAVPKRQEPEGRLPEFSADDYAEYFSTLDDLIASDPWFTCDGRGDFAIIFRLLIHSGADVSEVLSRTVADCMLNGLVPRIVYKRSKVNTPQRAVPIPASLAAEIMDLIRRDGLTHNSLLFARVAPSGPATAHERIRERMGRDELRLKDLRHVAAINWRRSGVDILKIKDWLGHATLNQTMRYAAYKPDGQEDAEEAERAAARLMIPTPVIPFRASG